MPDSPPTVDDARYGIFIAHAGADTEPARKLHAALERRRLRPYVDAIDLELGDSWDARLAEAQGHSSVTAVLISKAALEPPGGRPAHYWLEEIANAIHLARNDPDRHRVVPVYLEGAAGLEGVPYGLRRLNALLMEDVESAAQALADLIERLRARSGERMVAPASAAGEGHDLLIDLADDELRFIHLCEGRIAESSSRYDSQMLEALQDAAKVQGRYDERVAAVAARSLLPRKVRDRLAVLDDDDRIHFHLAEDAWWLPWELLLVGHTPISLRCATSRQPRGTDSVWHRKGASGRQPTVLVFTTASKSLPGVRLEAEGVAKTWMDRGAAVRLLWDPSLLELEEALTASYDVLHFAGHAWFERDDGESYLGLCRRLSSGDDGYHYSTTRLIEALEGHVPTVVCLNSHFTAFVGPVFRPGQGYLPATIAARRRIGFARPMLGAGVAAFVGAYGEPDDHQASRFGILFNEELARGAAVGEAAFSGRQWARVGSAAAGGAEPADATAWRKATVASYIVAGDADTRVSDGSRPAGSGTLEVVGAAQSARTRHR